MTAADWTALIAAIGSTSTPIVTFFGALLYYRERHRYRQAQLLACATCREAIKVLEPPKLGPLLVLAVGAYLVSLLCLPGVRERLARLVMPPLDLESAQVKEMPRPTTPRELGAATCSKVTDCDKDERCEGGRCLPATRKPHSPRRVAELKPGDLGDFPETPWMVSALSPPMR